VKKWVVVILCAIILFVVALKALGIEETLFLLCGWTLFLWDNLHKVSVNPTAVVTGAVVLMLPDDAKAAFEAHIGVLVQDCINSLAPASGGG
jgi:hypothetical protein